jgi:hypothetical protein
MAEEVGGEDLGVFAFNDVGDVGEAVVGEVGFEGRDAAALLHGAELAPPLDEGVSYEEATVVVLGIGYGYFGGCVGVHELEGIIDSGGGEEGRDFLEGKGQEGGCLASGGRGLFSGEASGNALQYPR